MKLPGYDLHALTQHVLGKRLPAPPLASPPVPPAAAGSASQQPSTSISLSRSPCVLASAIALLELCDEMACVQNAIGVAEKSGFAPNLYIKTGLPGAALCMVQRCAEARGMMLPFDKLPSISSSTSLLDHHLPSALICTAEAIGTVHSNHNIKPCGNLNVF